MTYLTMALFLISFNAFAQAPETPLPVSNEADQFIENNCGTLPCTISTGDTISLANQGSNSNFQHPTAIKALVTEQGQGVNIRLGPSVNFPKISSTLKSGDPILVIDQLGSSTYCSNGWYKILQIDESQFIDDMDNNVSNAWVCSGNDAHKWIDISQKHTSQFNALDDSTTESFSYDLKTINARSDKKVISILEDLETQADQIFLGRSATPLASSLGYYLSVDLDLNETDTFLGSIQSTLSEKQPVNAVTKTLNIPDIIKPGTYQLLFVTDHLNHHSENDKSNNIEAITITVTNSNTIHQNTLTEGVNSSNQTSAHKPSRVSSDRTIYEPSYFARYKPNSASDMVSQIPGFTLSYNTNNSRGLGQGSGNLLINEKRPNIKDIDLLNLIPAENVSRIEILTNGSAELAGQSGQIVNIVTVESQSLSGSWDIGIDRVDKGVLNPNIEITLANKISSFNITSGVYTFNNKGFVYSLERSFEQNGATIEISDQFLNFEDNDLGLNLAVNWSNEKGSIANLSFSGESLSSASNELSNFFLPDPIINSSHSDIREENNAKFDSNHYELGVDYSSQFAGGEFTTIGLRRYDKSNDLSSFQSYSSLEPNYLFDSTTQTTEIEHILKTLYSKSSESDHNFEVALELVDNSLETFSTFREDVGNGFIDAFLSGSDIEVTEDRAEISMQYSKPIRKDWTLQTLIASEYSKISVSNSGIEENTSDFIRFKGFIALGGPLTENTRLRSRLERSVEQLNFYDFASSQNISEGTIQSGNVELVPPEKWRLELSIDHDFSDETKFSVTGFIENTDDYVTTVPLKNGTEGLGNIDDFKRLGIEINTSIATDRIGITGGRLDLIGNYFHTQLLDPVTNKKRKSGVSPFNYEINFSQEVSNTPYAWGTSFIYSGINSEFLVSEILTYDYSFPESYSLYLEDRDFFGHSLIFAADNFTKSSTLNTRREFFDGDRNGGVVSAEEKSTSFNSVFSLRVSGDF